jgi:hypothetical protein
VRGKARQGGKGQGPLGGMRLCIKMHALPEAADSETHLGRRSCRGGDPQPAPWLLSECLQDWAMLQKWDRAWQLSLAGRQWWHDSWTRYRACPPIFAPVDFVTAAPILRVERDFWLTDRLQCKAVPDILQLHPMRPAIIHLHTIMKMKQVSPTSCS